MNKENAQPADITFEVEAILDHRTNRLGTTLFLIKWLGYDPKFNSWEPEENLVGSEELLPG